MYKYGEEVSGFEQRVLNEREARAGASIMFLFGLLAMSNCFMLSSLLFAQVFISFFMFDFFIRTISAKHSPSLLLGRLFVQNQDPEYVGAKQKRFSWGLGFVFSTYMFYTFMFATDISIIAILLCFACLTLLFLEAGFSICIGCFIYGWIDENKLMYCPGGSCQLKFKEPVQRFDNSQKLIAALSILGILSFIYFYTFKVETKTYMGQKLQEYFMTQEDWKKQNELNFEKQLREFEEEDF